MTQSFCLDCRHLVHADACGFTVSGECCDCRARIIYRDTSPKGKSIPESIASGPDADIILTTGDRFRVGHRDAERIKEAIKAGHSFFEIVGKDGRRALIRPGAVAVIERVEPDETNSACEKIMDALRSCMLTRDEANRICESVMAMARK